MNFVWQAYEQKNDIHSSEPARLIHKKILWNEYYSSFNRVSVNTCKKCERTTIFKGITFILRWINHNNLSYSTNKQTLSQRYASQNVLGNAVALYFSHCSQIMLQMQPFIYELKQIRLHRVKCNYVVLIFWVKVSKMCCLIFIICNKTFGKIIYLWNETEKNKVLLKNIHGK